MPKQRVKVLPVTESIAKYVIVTNVRRQRKELRNGSVREKRAFDEMIEFSDSDCSDLRKIMEHVDGKDVPADMALLWEMQTKQLASKSPAGYRWHPRYKIYIHINYYLYT